ncbi:Uncharacterised protein [Mycobacteroides abscessus subsp. abscessus]|nr:Uncharacterised protein [Mycobacteroides abscessus subsp. abscessus]
MLAHVRVDACTVAQEHRLAVPGVDHTACEVGNRGEAHLCRGHDPIQRETDVLAQLVARCRLIEPLTQQRGDDGDRCTRILQRQEDAEDRGFEFR